MYRYVQNRVLTYLKLLLAATDVLFYNLFFVLALMLAMEFGWIPTISTNSTIVFSLMLTFNFVFVISCLYTRIYSDERIEYLEKVFKSTLNTGVLMISLYSLSVILIIGYSGTYFLLLLLLLCSAYAILSRFVLVYIYNVLPKRMGWTKSIVVIGHQDYLSNVVSSFPTNHAFYTLNTIPYYDTLDPVTKEEKVAQFRRYFEEVSSRGIYEIFLVNSPDVAACTQEIITEADFHCVKLNVVDSIAAGLNTASPTANAMVFDLPVLRSHKNSLSEMDNRIKKRIVDLLISSFVIVFFLSWMIPLIGLIIKIQSPGPIFFKQPRSGRNNRSFNCLKFRSMVVNSNADSKQASKGDKRITSIGQFLRKSSLDEFPQFINVFLGDMSIVGPRPHMLSHTEHYSKLIQHYMVRHYVKPGITGWAQVNGFRGETKEPYLMARRVEYDLEYMNNWSVMLDFKIIAMTALNMAKGEKNAY